VSTGADDLSTVFKRALKIFSLYQDQINEDEMGGVCRMGKSEFKSGNLKGIHRLEDILKEEEKVFKIC